MFRLRKLSLSNLTILGVRVSSSHSILLFVVGFELHKLSLPIAICKGSNSHLETSYKYHFSSTRLLQYFGGASLILLKKWLFAFVLDCILQWLNLNNEGLCFIVSGGDYRSKS